VTNRSQKFENNDELWRFQIHEQGALNCKHIWILDVEDTACEIVENLYRTLLGITKKVLLKEGLFTSDKEFLDIHFVPTGNYTKAIGLVVKMGEFDIFEYEAAQLQKVLIPTEVKKKVAFWINMYNLLSLHGIVSVTCRGDNPLEYFFQRKSFFKNMKYLVGGHEFTLDDIEHGILTGDTNPTHFNETDPRIQFRLDKAEPRIFSALNCVTRSSAKPLIIDHTHTYRYLNFSAKRFFSRHAQVHDNYLLLPRICSWYESDFGTSREQLVKHVQRYLTPKQNAQIAAMVKANKFSIKFSEYEWETFLEFDEYDLDPIAITALL